MEVQFGLVGLALLLVEYVVVAGVEGVVSEGGEVLGLGLLGDVHSLLFQLLQPFPLQLVLLPLPLRPMPAFGHAG